MPCDAVPPEMIICSKVKIFSIYFIFIYLLKIERASLFRPVTQCDIPEVDKSI